MSGEDNFPFLPKGWAWTELEELVLNPKNDIVDGPFGSDLKASEYVDEGIPIIRLQNVERNLFITKNIRYIRPEKARQLRRHSFSKDDIVITKLGDPLGEACIVPQTIGEGIIVADIVRLRIDEKHVSRKYLVYAINSDFAVKQFKLNTKGTTRPRVNLGYIRKLKIPIAPFPEQIRIAVKIEELFTKLDAGVESLRKVRTQLKRYRQAVLKYAFEGKLTEEWLKTHKDQIEPASILLECIKEERKKKLEEKYRELPPIDTSDLPELPELWTWIRIKDISEIILGQSPPSSTYNENGNGLPFYQGKLEFGKIYPSPRKWCTAPKKTAEKGDVLISVRAPVGPTNICPGKSCIGRGLAAIRGLGGIETLFILYLMRTFESVIAGKGTGTTFNAITGDQLREIVIPLPPLHEQHKIIEEIERSLSVADKVEESTEQGLKQAERLRQSILKKAFGGKLVPQDPSDEPAEKLLARIKEGKARHENRTNKSYSKEMGLVHYV